MKNILVTGSLAFDYIMDFPQTFEENIIPEKIKTLSVSFLVENYSKNFGGVSANIAYNLSLLNQKAIILASWGEKDFKDFDKHLQKVNIETTFIKKVKNEFTANMFMVTDRNNCQIAGFYPGAMSKDEDLKIESIVQIKKIDLVVVSPTTPQAMNNFVNEAKRLKLPYLYDPAQQIPIIKKNELRNGIEGAEILICNDYEMALIVKKTGFCEKEILRKVKVLIITLGEKGSLIERGRQKIEIKSVKPKRIVDPTGAGDAYIAGFLKGYLNNNPLKICGQIGSTLAVYPIEQYGTQKHKFTIEQFKKRYQENFGESINF